jgi:hypothetical protein
MFGARMGDHQSSDDETESVGRPITPSQQRGRSRDRWCPDCSKRLSVSNWSRHLREVHSVGKGGKCAARSRRGSSPSLPRSRSSTSRDTLLSMEPPFPSNVELVEWRRCASAAFSFDARIFHDHYSSLRRLFPSISPLVTQGIAISAEWFAPILRASSRESSLGQAAEWPDESNSPVDYPDPPSPYHDPVCQTQTQETPLLSVEAFMRRVDAVSSTTMRRPDDKDHQKKKDQSAKSSHSRRDRD